MYSIKLAFSQDVMRIVCDVCKLVFNVQSNDEIQRALGLPHDQVETVIKKVITAMPDPIFNLTAQKLEEIKRIFAKEFIFFQVQEQASNPHYEDDLLNFASVFSRDIQERFVTSQAN